MPSLHVFIDFVNFGALKTCPSSLSTSIDYFVAGVVVKMMQQMIYVFMSHKLGEHMYVFYCL